MCGILGLLTPSPSGTELDRAQELLLHRGPDDAGVYVGDGVVLATRRLSIIDLAGGHQPMSNEDGTVWVTFNGEVVNAGELRADLVQEGHVFRTRSDTEVIVHAYEQWGDECVARLRGMFAFGLWDSRRRRLLLARDRFGMKPLYYARVGDRFAFASEIRPLLSALTELPRGPDFRALRALFMLGFIPSPLTAFAGVSKLPAAHVMTVESGKENLERYWQLHFPPEDQHRTLPLEDAGDKFFERLRETVEAWRVSDVPVGSLLSGGVDSGSLAALLTELGGSPIHTFHVGFTETSHDESEAARRTSMHLGSRHSETVFSEASFDLLPLIVRHLEEPQCSATSLPIYLLYKACHVAGFKVIMTGEGADELLGGYHWFDGDRRLRPLLRLPRALRALAAALPFRASSAARNVLRHGSIDPIERFLLWHQIDRPDSGLRLFKFSEQDQAGHFTEEHLLRPWRRSHQSATDGRHPLDQFLLLESRTRMVDFINFEVDRMSMANSVEARPPFLDHRLWEFCAQLPPQCKLDSRYNKLALRHGMRGRLPDAVRWRPKIGLASPHAAWWRSARLPEWAEDWLSAPTLADAQYFEPAEVARLRRLHRAGIEDASRILTGVLTTQLWHASVLRS